jgi:GNAT superfamily N-acetyltransferase
MHYKIDFKTGFYDNFDLLKAHNMYEKKYQYSTFKFDLKKDKEKFKERDMTTLIAFDGDTPIAYIRFDHEYDNKQQFQYKYIKRNFTALGLLMIYVEPEYRKKGIATDMISYFEKELLNHYKECNENLNIYAIINAVDLAFDLVEKNLNFFIPSHTFGNFNKNKNDLKSRIRFFSSKTLEEKITLEIE